MFALERVIKAFQENRIAYAVVGGVAVALHGAPRGTVNIDLVISHSRATFLKVESTLRQVGFVPRLPVTAGELFEFRKEYIERRKLIAWSFYNPKNPIEVVDIVITHNLDQMSTVQKKFGTFEIPVLSLKHLISMKQDSGRPQDLEDIKVLNILKTKSRTKKKS